MARKNLNIENRKSNIRGQIIDTKECTFKEFEVETAYTRSDVKAASLVLDALKLDASRYMVKVNEIINESVKPIIYDTQDLFERAESIWLSEDEFEIADGYKVIPFANYVYTCQVWAIHKDGEYQTENWEYEARVKLGKVDTRAALVMNYERENPNYKVIGIHADKREEKRLFAYISEDALAQVKTHEA